MERQKKDVEAARSGFDREKHRSADLEAKLRSGFTSRTYIFRLNNTVLL
jgi:hypothetical protein